MKQGLALRKTTDDLVVLDASVTPIGDSGHPSTLRVMSKSASAIQVSAALPGDTVIFIYYTNSKGEDVGVWVPYFGSSVLFPFEIPVNVELMAIAEDAEITSGILVINFFQ